MYLTQPLFSYPGNPVILKITVQTNYIHHHQTLRVFRVFSGFRDSDKPAALFSYPEILVQTLFVGAGFPRPSSRSPSVATGV